MAKKRKSTKELRKPVVCRQCGRTFYPKRKSQKYCNDTCRAAYYEEHYFAKTEVTKICPNCGTEFPTTMPKKQVYCSPECRAEAAKARAEGIVSQYRAEKATYLGDRYATFERDDFRCTTCGRGIKGGAVLDVEEYEGGLRTICSECKAGKDFIKGE